MSEDEKKWEDMKECYKGTDMALLIKKVSALETRFDNYPFKPLEENIIFKWMEEKLKELEHTIGARALGKYSLYELLLDYKTENTMKINELEQKIDSIEIKNSQQDDQIGCNETYITQINNQLNEHLFYKIAENTYLPRTKRLEAVLREFMFLYVKEQFTNEDVYKHEYIEIINKLGSEEKAYTEGLGGIPFAGQKPIEKSPAEDHQLGQDYDYFPFEQLIPQTPEFRKAMESIAKEPSEVDEKCFECKYYIHIGRGCRYVQEDECIPKGYKYFKPRKESPAEDKYQIDGIEYHREYETTLVKKAVEREREELIAEILNDLKEIHSLFTLHKLSVEIIAVKIDVEHRIDKWEARKKQ